MTRKCPKCRIAGLLVVNETCAAQKLHHGPSQPVPPQQQDMVGGDVSIILIEAVHPLALVARQAILQKSPAAAEKDAGAAQLPGMVQ